MASLPGTIAGRRRVEVLARPSRPGAVEVGRTSRRLEQNVARINDLEPELELDSNEQLRRHVARMRGEAISGMALGEFLFESFAVTREAAKRTLGQRVAGVAARPGRSLISLASDAVWAPPHLAARPRGRCARARAHPSVSPPKRSPSPGPASSRMTLVRTVCESAPSSSKTWFPTPFPSRTSPSRMCSVPM